jgi:shikimate dehydrogenase
MTQGQIPLAGVIGDPTAHSKSPRLHGYWLRHYGLAGHYVPLHVRADHLAQVLKSMPDMGFVGANVTIPHKQAAIALADEVTETARRIGAANTLTFLPDGRLHADNTDAHGFIENIRQSAPQWQPQVGPALVLGAGGAARAVLVALLDAGAPEVWLANRTAETAAQLAQEFGPRIKPVDWAKTETYLGAAKTVVNTTSLGMSGHGDFPFSFNRLAAETVVNDIVYTPLETPFLLAAKAQGCHCVDGLGMLLHQAAPGFARWFGKTPTVDAATRQAVLG